MQLCVENLRREGRRIAFVPTMGFLHEGHLSLIRIGRKAADTLVASIFVNPAQFGPGEDFDTYPRDLERDLQLLKQEGVDIVFTPDKSQLYPDNYQTYIKLDHLPQHLCGISRPVFFTGVATVVAKLFNIVKPHLVVFGEKDYQQLLIIRRMVQDLNMDIEIIGAPIVRETDGLAMSSRNNYLTPEQRPAARTLYQSLTRATELVKKGVRDAAHIISEAQQIIGAYPDAEIDYLAVCDPETLDDVQKIDHPALMALAVKIGGTRLIDNTILDPTR
jgi:pantoate--beta-alanine ligase